MIRVAFYTLGCKVNQYETEALSAELRSRGHAVVSGGEFADVYIINTCTVTGLADRKSRQYIRRAKKANPDGIVVVTGCYAEVSPDDVAGIDGVDIVFRNDKKMDLPDYLEKFLDSGGVKPESVCAAYTKTRALIKIQDGCDRFCSYCIVPYARGALRSRPLADIVREAENLLENGFKEIVLTGINTALYGAECGDGGIEDVISALDGIGGDFRIRLSSLEPTVINADYVRKLFRFEKLCHHMHLSLQSGSNRILNLMNRKYSISDYMEIVRILKEFDSHYGISTDIIAGFPGETPDDFGGSVEALRNVNFCRTHVFKYSERKGTVAAKMGGQIGAGEKDKRSGILIREGKLSAQRFFNSNIDGEKRVLLEEYDENAGIYSGYSENYIRVYINKNYVNNINARCVINELVDVRLTGIYEDGMLGEIRRDV